MSNMSDYRLMLCYKGDISALTLFVQNGDGSIFFPQNIPALSSPLEPEAFQSKRISLLPAVLINTINQQMRLDNDLLRAESGFNEQIETAKGIITVYLARFTLLDPPHKLMQSKGCTLKTLPELRGRLPTDMELLRRAYTYLMES